MIEQSRRGRHRAPSRLSNSVSSTARVSAVVAVTGGLVATGVGTADAAQSVATLNTPTKSSVALNSPNVATLPASASTLAAVTVGAPQLPRVVEARQLIVKTEEAAPAPVAKTVKRSVASKVTRNTTRPASRDAERPPVPTTETTSATAAKVIEIAKRYIGTPYVYGGSTPSGFDCSGFTSYVYRQVGIELPRSSRAQRAAARSTSNPQPGDLLFSGYPVHHVAIYLGNGMVIDAPKPGGSVQIHKYWGGELSYGRVL